MPFMVNKRSRPDNPLMISEYHVVWRGIVECHLEQCVDDIGSGTVQPSRQILWQAKFLQETSCDAHNIIYVSLRDYVLSRSMGGGKLLLMPVCRQ